MPRIGMGIFLFPCELAKRTWAIIFARRVPNKRGPGDQRLSFAGQERLRRALGTVHLSFSPPRPQRIPSELASSPALIIRAISTVAAVRGGEPRLTWAGASASWRLWNWHSVEGGERIVEVEITDA